jgi:DNA helicase INO80
MKEVRKKTLKTQRLVKETTGRAKKLTREMMNFWKRRDKELADLKKRKEKFEKEIKRKQEEEKENQLQKKRLEFIMNQSEIYAHFMSKKLGLHDEQQKQRKEDLEDEHKERFLRVDVDEATARSKVASIINDNRQRVVNFDAEVSNKKSAKF